MAKDMTIKTLAVAMQSIWKEGRIVQRGTAVIRI
jgi:hypothetical protein